MKILVLPKVVVLVSTDVADVVCNVLKLGSKVCLVETIVVVFMIVVVDAGVKYFVDLIVVFTVGVNISVVIDASVVVIICVVTAVEDISEVLIVVCSIDVLTL